MQGLSGGGGKKWTYVGEGQVKVEAEVGKEYVYKESREPVVVRRSKHNTIDVGWGLGACCGGGGREANRGREQKTWKKEKDEEVQDCVSS